uniref:Uncharacterized protein n=1 Tax=Tetradesmus obliquus TaxID=3088 RepID=A0A383VEI6_TETOB|eukprot:jgi/Sobl393_1/16766/SZX63927.1
MAKHQLNSCLAVCFLLSVTFDASSALSPRAQGHRFYEGQQLVEAAAGSSSSRPEIPSSPAVAMNPPADDQDDGSIEAPAPSAQLQSNAVSPSAAAAAAAAAAAVASRAAAAADAQQPAVPQLDLDGLGNNQQPFPASTSSDRHEAAMFWDPDSAWGSWGSAAFEQHSSSQPTSYSIQVSSFGSSDSPQRVVISGSVNGKPLTAAVAGVTGSGSSSSNTKPAFKPETLAGVTDTLGSYGLSLDWGQDDAWRLVQSVEQQLEQQMTSVQGVFDSMLADASEGLLRLESLANGGLLDWQQRMLGMGGGWRRKLKSSGSSSSGSSSGAGQGQLDVLRLLTSRPNSRQ